MRTGKDATKPRALGLLGHSVVAILSQTAIVFAHADVTPLVGPPYWITARTLWTEF